MIISGLSEEKSKEDNGFVIFKAVEPYYDSLSLGQRHATALAWTAYESGAEFDALVKLLKQLGRPANARSPGMMTLMATMLHEICHGIVCCPDL
jgi:hypothetical protein